MHIRAVLLLIVSSFFTSSIAFSNTAQTTEDQRLLQQLITFSYQNPRIMEVIRQAQSTHRSISVDIDPRGMIIDAREYSLSATTEIAPKPPKPVKSEPFTHFGAMIDAGVPDGIGVSLVGRPWKWLRLQFGGNYTGFSGGIHGGVTFLPPIFFPILPSLSIEAGHTFEGDVNQLIHAFVQSWTNSPWLQHIDYDYVNGHLGLEFGSQNRFIFFIHGGVSYVHGVLHNFKDKLDASQSGSSSSSGGTSVTGVQGHDPVFDLVVPSGKLGFIVYFI